MPTAGSRKALQATQSRSNRAPVLFPARPGKLHCIIKQARPPWDCFLIPCTQLSSHFTTNKGVSGTTMVYIQWPPNKTVQKKTSLLIPRKRHGTQVWSSLCMKISNSEDPRSPNDLIPTLPQSIKIRLLEPILIKLEIKKAQPPLLLLSPVFSTVLASNTSRGLL